MKSNNPKGEAVNDEVLTSRQVAILLQVHIYTVHDLLRTQRLEGFKIRKRWRVKRSSLDRFMSVTIQKEK